MNKQEATLTWQLQKYYSGTPNIWELRYNNVMPTFSSACGFMVGLSLGKPQL